MKLNIVCHEDVKPGYINIDICPAPRRGIIAADARTLPFKDNTFEEIYVFQFMAYLTPAEIVPTLLEWKRVLHPDGKLLTRAPDMHLISFYWTKSSIQDKLAWWQEAIYGSQRGPDQHRIGLDKDVLNYYFKTAKFAKWRHWPDSKYNFWLWSEVHK